MKLRRSVDWTKVSPTRERIWAALIIWMAISLLTMAAMYAAALSGKADIVIGGDYVSFHTAARMLAESDLLSAYDKDLFQAKMVELGLTDRIIDLTWQYPPTYFFVLAPLSPFPHLAGFALWSTGTLIAFFLTMRNFVRDRLILAVMIAGPAAFTTYITGQNGFAAAALLALAAIYPSSRPILAGVAAGVLTMKPHFGLLIPLAYAAAGCWRAFAAAAVTAIALALASVAVFGADLWGAFVQSMLFIGGRVEGAIMPLSKMATPYSAAVYAGLPGLAAKLVYAGFIALAVAFVWRVWRRCDDALLRGAALISCVFFAAPYGYHYDLAILALPVAIIASIGATRGWLRFERPLIAAIVLLPAVFGSVAEIQRGVSLPALTVILVFTLAARRIAHEFPETAPRFAQPHLTAA